MLYLAVQNFISLSTLIKRSSILCCSLNSVNLSPHMAIAMHAVFRNFRSVSIICATFEEGKYASTAARNARAELYSKKVGRGSERAGDTNLYSLLVVLDDLRLQRRKGVLPSLGIRGSYTVRSIFARSKCCTAVTTCAKIHIKPTKHSGGGETHHDNHSDTTTRAKPRPSPHPPPSQKSAQSSLVVGHPTLYDIPLVHHNHYYSFCAHHNSTLVNRRSGLLRGGPKYDRRLVRGSDSDRNRKMIEATRRFSSYTASGSSETDTRCSMHRLWYSTAVSMCRSLSRFSRYSTEFSILYWSRRQRCRAAAV